MPALMPHPRATTRRTALAALLLGSAGLVAWQWPQHTPPRPSGNAALEGIGDDVCVVAPPTPYDPALGQPLAAAREVPADARCPVCGMYPARARAWAAQVIFADGDAYFFDSPLSLMLYLGNVAHYTRGRTAEAIVARYVTDTGTGGWLNAQEAVYVTGSSAMGPMRAGNLPAFADAEAALRFAQQRGGRSVPFGAIDAPLLRGLAPNLRADHRRHSG
ncbi:nitrous oxide reductase accessory protein NosL [Acidovorax radicis]|uniref:nitrous oxide reductase accessory protein NosL n=2 Tax=Acidovorax radicis TaxID=758826 RepID=UPI0002376658|nr:nitrous oxide reductase accessory protein NosL [Acidovorax radicis]